MIKFNPTNIFHKNTPKKALEGKKAQAFTSSASQNLISQGSFSPLLSSLSYDTFIKSTAKIDENAPIDEKRIREIYDATFKKVMEDHPFIKELNYQKPELKFIPKDPNSPNTLAHYEFVNNSISVHPKLTQNDFFIIYLASENEGEEEVPLGICLSEENPEELKKEYEAQGTKVRFEKATRAEKESFISATLAHELRHSIQEHLAFSTRDTFFMAKADMMELRNNIDAAFGEAVAELEEEYRKLPSKENKKELEENKAIYKEESEKPKYLKSYKPKKILTDNNILKYSIYDDDNRYWSTKDHFKIGPYKKPKYQGNPKEVDAFHYEAEFIMRESMHNKKIRQDFAIACAMDFDKTCSILEMFVAGFPGLVTKK